MKKAEITEKTFDFAAPLSKRASTNRIIIHHTGGADIDAYSEQIHKWHLAAGYAGIGYHFVIRKSGEIERGRPAWAVGSHAYGANFDSLGIHLSGDFTYNKPTNFQIESCANLIANLCAEYVIPIDRKHIIGHRETIATDCPGNFLFNMLDVIVWKALWYRFNNADVIDQPKIQLKAPRAGMLSEHFSAAEFDGNKVSEKLLQLLEQLRYNCGGYPLYIKSGKDNVAEIYCPDQLTLGQFKWYIEQLPFKIKYFYDYVEVAV